MSFRRACQREPGTSIRNLGIPGLRASPASRNDEVWLSPQSQLVVPGRALREPGTHNHRKKFGEG
jgi:hypothetical protein